MTPFAHPFRPPVQTPVPRIFLIIIYRPFFPPGYSRMKIVVCMLDFGCRCIGRSTLWQDQSPGQTTLFQCSVSRTFNIAFGLMCLPEPGGLRACCVRLASLAAAKGLDVPPCYGSLRSKPGAALGRELDDNSSSASQKRAALLGAQH
ncbi:hypothetical protein Salat_2882100 [Sesamum alatum]|uniref:Uncharacterized protein n=1 Tax=Sesamum alatum TaxID=300844 RepID=A0AAE1XNN5_9LAMI|nr:hypothetical protein Salat_2882100 [Sesamum alatum]